MCIRAGSSRGRLPGFQFAAGVMGLIIAVLRVIPGVRHIAMGQAAAGVAWFALFVIPLNFGVLAPLAWPGREARVVRVVLCGVSGVVLGVSHRRASEAERMTRRREARRAARAVDARLLGA